VPAAPLADAHQHDRVVLRKEAEIVVEHGQAEAAELGVGRVDVDHVDASCGDGVVGEDVVEPDRLALARAVGLAQRRPAVGTLQELVREA